MPAAEAASANRLQRYLDADATVEWSEADI
jgi:hypothetical protein